MMTMMYSVFLAAKGVENAALVSKELNDTTAFVDYMKKASKYYRESNNPENAGQSLSRAAKYVNLCCCH